MAQIISGLPASVKAVKSATGVGSFYTLPASVVAEGRLESIKIPRVQRFLALDRPSLYWSQPVWGAAELVKFQQGQMLLVERTDHTLAVLLPLIDGNLRATLKGAGSTLTLQWEGLAPGQAPHDATLLYAATGRDVYTLMEGALRAVRVKLDSFRLLSEKRMPAFCDTLGWCTWNAFYTDVDEKKVLRGLESFKKGGILPGFIILDDGWLNRTADYLNDFPADPKKFPHGLAPLIAKAKEKFGVKYFGIWHAFQGYWMGLHPEGALFSRYKTIHNKGGIRPWKPEEIGELYHVAPEDVYRFFQEFHDYLRRQGADFVKVDGQSATEVFTAGVQGRAQTMAAWQKALQGSVETHFEGEIIHCMSNGSDVAYNMLATSGFRNSNDYFPDRPESHGMHLAQNAMNSLWSSQFALPDWDMFWSGHPEGAFHAASRALSGGPVYISDRPGDQDFAVLRKLVTADGRLLRPDRPALPAADCVFVDVLKEPVLLKITNRSGRAGLLGMFNCHQDGPPIHGTFSPSDGHDLSGENFVAYRHQAQTLELLKHAQRAALEIAPLGFEVITLAPLLAGSLAWLGLLDQYIGVAALQSCVQIAPRTWCLMVSAGGRAGLYVRTQPQKIAVNGRVARGRYVKKTGLLTLELPAVGPLELLVTLA